MPAMLHMIRIQNEIQNLARGADYYRIGYDKDTYNAFVMLEADGVTPVTEAPATCVCHEVAGGFSTSRNMRSFSLQQTRWDWQLWLKFNNEVSAEPFREAWAASPPLLLRRTFPELPFNVRLLLLDYNSGHPVKQSPSSGSEFFFSVRAELSRR